MGGRINTVMQTCFFAISGVLPRDEAIAAIKHSIEKTYGKRGESVVRKNFAAVDAALEHLHEVKVPERGHLAVRRAAAGPGRTLPSSCATCEALMIAGEGDQLPVSAMPIDGTFPTAPRSGRSATSRSKFRCGTRSSASSAASASWSARTRSSAPRSTTPAAQSRARGLPDGGAQVAGVLAS